MERKAIAAILVGLTAVCLSSCTAVTEKKNYTEETAAQSEITGNVEETASSTDETEASETVSEAHESSAGNYANTLFAFELSPELAECADVEITDTCITVYEKRSRADFGGLAFAVTAYEDPDKYANAPGVTKLGEVISADGKLYDVIIVRPTDVQYDIEAADHSDYEALYEAGNTIADVLTGAEGSEYHAGAGMKGEDLYGDIIAKHIAAIKEDWDSERYSEEDMSSLYALSASDENFDLMNEIGFAYIDLNSDDIDELIIGTKDRGDDNGKITVWDMYTMVNRAPAHVLSGHERRSFHISEHSYICEHWSNGAAESGETVYCLTCNSTELCPQITFKYDYNADYDAPWFISYGAGDEFEAQSEEEFEERRADMTKPKAIELTPLSSFTSE